MVGRQPVRLRKASCIYYLKAPARLGMELENLGTLHGQRKSRNGPVTSQPIPHTGITEPLPEAL